MHDFYLAVAKHQDGGLDFPKTAEPTYPDFIYLAMFVELPHKLPIIIHHFTFHANFKHAPYPFGIWI